VRLLETVQDVLEESLEHVRGQSDNTEVCLEAERVKLTECEQARDLAVTAAADSKTDFESQEKTLSMAQEGCEDAKTDLITAKEVKQQALESRDGLIKDQERFAAVHGSFMELLEDESCTGEARTLKLE